jgi:cytochrome c-type biogenesis protein CcmH
MKRFLLSFLVLFLATLLDTPAQATLESLDFSGKVSEQRYKNLIEELRCLVCQNESLVGSQAELAQDLRQEVYALMAQGKSDQEVVDFLVARYGDFVLYNPPVKPSTYLLWYGPFVLAVIALVVLYRTISRRKQSAEVTLSQEEQTRVDTLLRDASTKRDDT